MTDPVVPTPKPVKRNAEQDQIIADKITAAAQYLDTVEGDPEISAVLVTRGYDTAKLKEGRTLHAAAQSAFTQRQLTMAAQGQATAGLSGNAATAREMVVDFRETVRSITAFTAADRVALKVNGTLPTDKQKFITLARASYEAAQQPPYAATLATYGFPAATITAALAALDAYSKADTDQNTAIGAATKATADRNAAVKALDAYMKQLRGIAKVALRKRPDLFKKLNA
jgi:hypothetical protein